jgi:hypothetical protein
MSAFMVGMVLLFGARWSGQLRDRVIPASASGAGMVTGGRRAIA